MTLWKRNLNALSSTIVSENLSTHWNKTNEHAATRRLEIARQHKDDYLNLDLEFPNLKASFLWLSEQSNYDADQKILYFLDVISPYFEQRSLHTELLEWCHVSIKACKRLDKDVAWIYALRSKANYALGLWGEALADSNLAHSLTDDSTELWGETIFNIGRILLNKGEYRKALITMKRAESFWSERENDEMLARIRSEIASYYLNKMELPKALKLYQEVDNLEQRSGVKESSDHILLMLGVVYRRLREYRKSISYFEKIIKRYNFNENPNAIATANHHLAWVYINLGRQVKARELCGKATEIYVDIGDTRGLSDAYEQLALIDWSEGFCQRAINLLQQSLHLRQQIGNQHGIASCLRHMGTIKIKTNQWWAGAKDIMQCLLLYWRLEMLGRQRALAIFKEMYDWTLGKKQWTV